MEGLVTCKGHPPGGGGNWIQTSGLPVWALEVGSLWIPPGLFHGRVALSPLPQAWGVNARLLSALLVLVR